MKALVVALFLLAFTPILRAQNKIETIANFGLRSADMAQTCYHLANYTNAQWHEYNFPLGIGIQNCGGVVAVESGVMVGTFLLDHVLEKHHPKWAHFQAVSAGGAAFGIAITFGR